jgi:hypothetical protein
VSTSTNGARRPTHNGHRQTAQHEVAAFFDNIAASGEQPRLRTVSGICQFNIAGAGTWRVALSAGIPTVTEGAQHTKHPDCVIACDAADFLRVTQREGHLNLYAAVLQGLVTISGDLAFAFTILGSATFRQAGAENALPR